MIDVLIRNIDSKFIEEIDVLAKEKKMSRNELMKIMLGKDLLIGTSEIDKTRLELTNEKIHDAILLHNKRMDDLLENYKKLFTLISLASGISPDDVDAVLLEKELRMWEIMIQKFLLIIFIYAVIVSLFLYIYNARFDKEGRNKWLV